MQKKPSKILRSLLLIILISTSGNAFAQEVKHEMHSLYEPFKELQPYIADSELFSATDNDKKIKELLSDLRSRFHSIESMPSRFRSQPGFDSNVQLVADLLDDASRRFTEGKKSYAWWRLRTLTGNCFGCHATYQVQATFEDSSSTDDHLDELKRARFLLATRQFKEAQESLIKVLGNPLFRLYHTEALRSLLIIFTRIDQSPKNAAATFEEILKTESLPAEDQAEVKRWLISLKAWAAEKKPLQPTILNAEYLVNGALKQKIAAESRVDAVSLLRGTALLHSMLERGGIKPEDRRAALYLLGASYSRLPMFFTTGWAEMYLEQCIDEFPGTDEAKKSYVMYQEITSQGFTGSAGTSIPADVQLHLDELKAKAFKQAGFEGRA